MSLLQVPSSNPDSIDGSRGRVTPKRLFFITRTVYSASKCCCRGRTGALRSVRAVRCSQSNVGLRRRDGAAGSDLWCASPLRETRLECAEAADATDYLLKIICIGESGTGKTCLLHHFLNSSYRGNSPHTIGVNFSSTVLKLPSTVPPASPRKARSNSRGSLVEPPIRRIKLQVQYCSHRPDECGADRVSVALDMGYCRARALQIRYAQLLSWRRRSYSVLW